MNRIVTALVLPSTPLSEQERSCDPVHLTPHRTQDNNGSLPNLGNAFHPTSRREAYYRAASTVQLLLAQEGWNVLL